MLLYPRGQPHALVSSVSPGVPLTGNLFILATPCGSWLTRVQFIPPETATLESVDHERSGLWVWGSGETQRRPLKEAHRMTEAVGGLRVRTKRVTRLLEPMGRGGSPLPNGWGAGEGEACRLKLLLGSGYHQAGFPQGVLIAWCTASDHEFYGVTAANLPSPCRMRGSVGESSRLCPAVPEGGGHRERTGERRSLD